MGRVSIALLVAFVLIPALPAQTGVEELERRLDSLTPREREVFALVVSGLLNKQIAGELGTSEKTIKVHRARVMQKMQADSLADLVRMGMNLAIRS